MASAPLDIEHLRVVLEKMDYVARISALECPTEQEIREMSSHLRFLLVDGAGHLHAAWRSCGFPKRDEGKAARISS